MSFDSEKLWNLLPAYLRTRDTEIANPNGPDAEGNWKAGPLQEFVNILGAQVAVLEENLDQLYDNHFVETAAPWALPYLGELLGIRGLPAGTMARSPRAEVGHTIAYRRRKGTAPMLELLARDITGWPSRAVEFFERLAATQHLNHERRACRSFARLRDAKKLEFVGTPFESLMRTLEVRRIEPGYGKWNIPNIGLFLWRLQAYPHSSSPLVPVEALFPGDPLAGRRFRLHPLNFDAQMFSHPETEADITHLAEPINVPLPITRRMLCIESENFRPAETLYGTSIALHEFQSGEYQVIPSANVVVCDLSDARDAANHPVWNHENKAQAGQVALDPVLGRVVFGTAPADARHPARGSFHLGFSFDLGGGEYGRASSFEADVLTLSQVPHDPQIVLPTYDTITEALNRAGTRNGAIEISETGRYTETLPDLTANAFTREIRGADERCPTVLLKRVGSGTFWRISGDENGSVSLNGLWLVGTPRVTGNLGAFKMRHCTVAPGYDVDVNGQVVPSPGAVLEISANHIEVTMENCVLPPLRLGDDNVRLNLRNCIIDAGSESNFALSNVAGNGPAGSCRLENCTVIGKVAVDLLELVSNSILLGESVTARRRQEGCVRFSWLPRNDATRTPRRYHCLPEESGANATVRPQFTSLTFGHPAYAQLGRRCPESIRTGGDDGAEMGAFHDLFQPQRDSHLRARIAEYLRFGLEAGVFYES